jgi:aminopeptidase N
MKIITKDNYCRDLFTEKVIAENVNEIIGNELVKQWNDKHWTEHSDFYLELVEDNYKLYDGYADII